MSFWNLISILLFSLPHFGVVRAGELEKDRLGFDTFSMTLPNPKLIPDGISSSQSNSGQRIGDTFLFCSIGCQLDVQQLSCERGTQAEYTRDGLLQYRGRVKVSEVAGDSSEVKCGTLDELQNCGVYWGVKMMDQQYPRISFAVKNVVTDDVNIHRVHVRYSSNGKDKTGNRVPDFNTMTAILSKLRISVLHPDSEKVLHTQIHDLESQHLNFGGFLNGCHSNSADSYYEFAFDLPALPNGPFPPSIIEVQSYGNYE